MRISREANQPKPEGPEKPCGRSFVSSSWDSFVSGAQDMGKRRS